MPFDIKFAQETQVQNNVISLNFSQKTQKTSQKLKLSVILKKNKTKKKTHFFSHGLNSSKGKVTIHNPFCLWKHHHLTVAFAPTILQTPCGVQGSLVQLLLSYNLIWD